MADLNQQLATIPIETELTLAEAANLLEISHSHLIKLLQSEELAYVKTGADYRIRLKEVLNHKQNRDRRLVHLREITQYMQENGFYDNSSVEGAD